MPSNAEVVALEHGAFFDTITVRDAGHADELVRAALENGVNIRHVDADRVAIAMDETTTVDHLRAGRGGVRRRRRLGRGCVGVDP